MFSHPGPPIIQFPCPQGTDVTGFLHICFLVIFYDIQTCMSVYVYVYLYKDVCIIPLTSPVFLYKQ